MSEREAGRQHPSRRHQVEPRRRHPPLALCLLLLLLLLLLWSPESAALADFAAEYKTRSVCENEELKLHCKESKLLNIYAASYGRSAHEKDICSRRHLPQFDCFSYSALEVLSKKCYGKQRCKIIANSHNFGTPCLPGVKKYLNVSYACVPKFLLAAVDPVVANVGPSWKPKEDINVDPRESRFPEIEGGIVISSILAAVAYIRDHPERAALLFVSSVCFGLVLTLCALAIRVSCSHDLENLQRMKKHLVPKDKSDGSSESEEEEEEEETRDSSDPDFPDELAGFCRTSYSAYYSMDSAELAERIERREQIIQEIWMNSGLDASPTRSLSPFYINEQECVCFG